MNINLDGYPPYSGAISEIFETMLMLIFSVIMDTIILQEKRKFSHGLMRKVGKSCKKIFLMLSK